LCEQTVLGEGGLWILTIHTNHTKHSHISHKSHKFESCFWQILWNSTSKSHYSQYSHRTIQTSHTIHTNHSHNPPTHPPFPKGVAQKRGSSWDNVHLFLCFVFQMSVREKTKMQERDGERALGEVLVAHDVEYVTGDD
jgi:hypothetical protein